MDNGLIDSGASNHITWEKSILTGYKEVQKVSVGDGQTLDSLEDGDVHVNMQFKVNKVSFTMLDTRC